MKKALLSVIGLSMSLVALANGEMKDGWLIVEDFESQPALATYNFNGNGKKASLTYTEDPDGVTGKVLDVKGSEWQEIIELDVTLPAGKTISDYAQIAFDYYVVKVTYKNIKVMADSKEIYYSSNYGNATSTGKWIEFATAIPETVTSGNQVKIRFGVDSGESGSEYYYDNVRLLPKADATGETKNGTMDGDDFMVEDFEASILGASYPVRGGVKASVVENPSGTGNVVKAANTNYSAFPQFSVKLPEGKTLANVKSVKFDLYVPTALEGQPSDPTFKQRRIAINDTEVYYDVQADGTTEDYPDSKAGDKWATVTLDINALGKLTDGMKALSEFELATGIHDNKITYYMDNVRLTLGEAEKPVDSVDPDKEYLITELDYIITSAPLFGSYMSQINTASQFEIDFDPDKVSTIVLNDASVKAPVYCDGDLAFDASMSVSKWKPYLELKHTETYYRGTGEYEVHVPAGCLTVNMKDGSTFSNPKMVLKWTMIQLPVACTKEDPLTDWTFVFDIARKSDYKFSLYAPAGGNSLWFQAYVVGYVDNSMEAHFSADGDVKNYYATLLAQDVNETDPDNCLWDTEKKGAYLYKEDEKHGRSTFHKCYLTRTTQPIRNGKNEDGTKRYVSAIMGFGTNYFLEVTPGQSGVEGIEAVEDSTVTVYNLQGIQLLKDADRAELSQLPAGLYIVNGKKMIVR